MLTSSPFAAAGDARVISLQPAGVPPELLPHEHAREGVAS